MNSQGCQAPFPGVWSVLFLEEVGGYMNVSSVKIHCVTLTICGFSVCMLCSNKKVYYNKYKS